MIARVRRPIALKLVLMMSVMILLSVVCTATFSIHRFSGVFTEEVQHEADRGVRGLEYSLNELRLNAESMASLLANTPAVREALRSGDPDAIAGELSAMAGRDNGAGRKVDFLTVVDAKGVVIKRSYSDKRGDSVANLHTVSGALSGKTTSAIEPGAVILLMSCAAAPIMENDGRILGAIVAGYDLSKNEFMDGVKRLFGAEVTLFGGDVRYATTIVSDGRRATGTKLAASVADRVLKKKDEFRGRTDILGVPFLTSYKPMLSPSGEVIGAYFAGKSLVGVLDATRRFVWFLALVMGLLFLLFLAGTFLFARRISRPLKLLVDLVRRVEGGDLTPSVGGIAFRSGDETEVLADAFGGMIETQRSTIEKTRTSAVETGEKARALSVLSERTTAAMERIERQVERLADLAANNAAALQQSGAGVHEIVIAATTAARASAQGAESAAKTARSSEEAGSKVREMIHAVRDLGEHSSRTVTMMEQMRNSVETITAFMERIASIADQTNLLALNAAIEAARAGDAGRGFAVVADEVRKLAEESNRTAGQVDKVVGNLKDSADAALDSMHEVDAIVEQTVRKAEDAGKRLEDALKEIERISDEIHSIAASAEEQAAASEQANEGIDSVAKALGEEVQSVDAIRAAVSEATAAARTTDKESRSMREAAGNLLAVLAVFRTGALPARRG